MARVIVQVAGRRAQEEVYARDVADLLEQLCLPPEVEVKVLRKGEELPPETELSEGDELTIVPILRGG